MIRNSEGGPPMARLGVPELIIIFVILLFTVVPFWKISQKAGYPGALGILSLIPLVNVIFFYFLAFAQWPVLKELEHLKSPQR